jgi:tetratricopeptide (TPR) repeat protein
LAEPLESIAIPDTVQAVLEARIDRLPEREKHLLQTAAVIGQEVPEALLARVSELPETDLDAALERLRRAEFLHETALFPEVLHAFKHPLTHQVAYEVQLRDRRAGTHASVAQALADLHASRMDEHAALIADHWERSGQRVKAAEWYGRALTWVSRTDPAETRRLAKRGLHLFDADSVDERGWVHALQAAKSFLAYGEIAGITREDAEEAFARAQAMLDAGRNRRFVSQRELLHHEAQMHMCFAGALTGGLADLPAAVHHWRIGMELADRAGSVGDRIWACGRLTETLGFQGRLIEASEVAKIGLDNPPEDVMVESFLGVGWPAFIRLHGDAANIMMYLGRYSDALRLLEEAERLSTPGAMCGVAKDVYIFLGDGERVVSQARASLELSLASGRLWHVMHAHLSLAIGHELRGELREAADEAERALEIVEQGVMPPFGPWIRSVLAWVQLRLGKRAIATELCTEVLEKRHTNPWAAYYCGKVLVGAVGEGGRESVGALIDAIRLASQAATAFSPLHHELHAQLARVCGDELTCERERAEAERLWTEMGAHGHIERMVRELEELGSSVGE